MKARRNENHTAGNMVHNSTTVFSSTVDEGGTGNTAAVDLLTVVLAMSLSSYFVSQVCCFFAAGSSVVSFYRKICSTKLTWLSSMIGSA